MRFVLDGWQVSGESDFVSGDWANVSMTTTDSFDFTGGEAGNGACLAGTESITRRACTGAAESRRRSADRRRRSADRFFNTAAFARPTRGTYGNAARNAVKKPGYQHQLRVFKNVNFGGSKAAQFRAEIYNLFNQVEFQDIDRTARFDTTGRRSTRTSGRRSASPARRARRASSSCRCV
jgi:hypothetical protein